METILKRAHDLWRRYVNPDHVDLLEVLGFGRAYLRARGTKLLCEDGRECTDFLAGFGVHNIGHNHPRLVEALRAALEACEPSMLHVDAPLPAALLAERLTSLTHPDLCRIVFASSGAEAVEAALKAARAATGRKAILSARGAYHGLTTGALSLMGDAGRSRPFGPLLPDVELIPFGDPNALEEACALREPAAFFVEPIQGEGGIRVPDPGYLDAAREITRRAGCLLVVDEIQTGLGRTGSFFATDFSAGAPDVLLVGKALSGGIVPVAAALMTERTWSRAFSGRGRSHLVVSTFSGNRLAMAAGLETLKILEEERLPQRSRELGDLLLTGLKDLARRHEMIREVRGRGLFIGVEFQPPSGLLRAAVPRWARERLFAQVVAALLLRDHGFLTQTCGLAPGVLRIEPPLVVSRTEIEGFVAALEKVLIACPSQGSAALAALRKAVLGRDL